MILQASIDVRRVRQWATRAECPAERNTTLKNCSILDAAREVKEPA